MWLLILLVVLALAARGRRDGAADGINVIEAVGPAYAAAAAIGALHGVEPGHGWPVAAAYAMGRRRPWFSGVASGALIGGAHLVSSFAVVAAFELVDRFTDVAGSGWTGLVAGLALEVMGVVQWRRGGRHHHHDGDHDHDHEQGEPAFARGLWGIVAFAFVLGFAHEEEFAVVALCAGRASCWGVMAVYAIAVATVILALTLLSLAAVERFRERLDPWRERLPRISAAILVTMGALYAIGII